MSRRAQGRQGDLAPGELSGEGGQPFVGRFQERYPEFVGDNHRENWPAVVVAARALLTHCPRTARGRKDLDVRPPAPGRHREQLPGRGALRRHS
nr:hypothetical protein [Streptomyces sp. ISL-100]